MSEFTSRHREQLRDYFTGDFEARFGLRSSLGGQLEAMENATVAEPYNRNDYMPVARDHSQHSEHFVTEEMLAAVRDKRRIETALTIIADDYRTAKRHCQILKAHYAHRPACLDRDPKIDVVLDSEDDARALMARSRHEDRDIRRDGKRDLASAEHRAGEALRAAEAAYAVAYEVVMDAERRERRGRFAKGLAA
jgi:hypothetical protein